MSGYTPTNERSFRWHGDDVRRRAPGERIDRHGSRYINASGYVGAGSRERIQAAIADLGFCVVTTSTDEDEERAIQELTVLRSHQADGLVVTPPETRAINDYLVAAARQRTPIVLIGMRLHPTCPSSASTTSISPSTPFRR